VNLAPLPQLLALAALLALLPLTVVWLRARGASPRARLAALTAITLFLTFDLIVFGAFTRLSDSGLGCPDWPGCYAAASPLGARADIHAAQTAMPTGPVTWSKAWIEMIHRYLAMVVGALILVMAVASTVWRRRLPHAVAWPLATLAWVIVQGLFGKYTVTLKLYPAVVTAHLLGGLVLLALLTVQHEAYRQRPLAVPRALAVAALVAVFVQAALGGWVSTNYAVLACTGFPACTGQWWPAMNLAEGFTVLRELGRADHGGLLTHDALVAIHMAHRLFALVAAGLVLWLAWRLALGPATRVHGLVLLALVAAQVASGAANVVFQWPLAAALAHSAGAAALVGVLVSLVVRGRQEQWT